MDPEKGKERFIKHFTPYSKYWWKFTLTGAVFFALGTHFLINRSVSWHFITDEKFYFNFIWYLLLTTVTNYYVFYKPNLKHHSGGDPEHSKLDLYDSE